MKLLTVAAATATLALLGAALPNTALAKSAPAANVPVKTVIQTVVTPAPKAEGWQTGDGDASNSDCQAYADRVQEYQDQANINAESGNYDQMFYDLDMSDMYEDAALDHGCAIKY